MRISVLLTSFVFAGAIGANAQDLQYRSTFTAEMAGVSNPMGEREITMYVKGKLVRMEMESGLGMSMTAFVDYPNRKMIAVLNDDVRELPLPVPDVSKMDSVAVRQAMEGFIIKETGETKEWYGYATKRMLTLAPDFTKMPGGADIAKMPGAPALGDNERLVMAGETWVATDTMLKRVYLENVTAMNSGLGGAPSVLTDLNKDFGFPIRMTMLLGRAPKTVNITAEEIIAGTAKDFQVMMRVVTETKEIKTGPLDPALFVAPKVSEKPKQ